MGKVNTLENEDQYLLTGDDQFRQQLAKDVDVKELLGHILVELKKLNIQMQSVTNDEVQDHDTST